MSTDRRGRTRRAAREAAERDTADPAEAPPAHNASARTSRLSSITTTSTLGNPNLDLNNIEDIIDDHESSPPPDDDIPPVPTPRPTRSASVVDLPSRVDQIPRTNLLTRALPQPTQPAVSFLYGGIIGRKSPDFEGKKRSHADVESWIRAHEMYHLLNEQVPVHMRTINSSQYLLKDAATWWRSLPLTIQQPGDNWTEFVRLFRDRWDELNWQDRAVEDFNTMKQEGSNADIENYNTSFQLAYLGVSQMVTEYIALRTYIGGLKSRTRADLERTYQVKGELTLHEAMAAAVRFERINVQAVRDHQQKHVPPKKIRLAPGRFS